MAKRTTRITFETHSLTILRARGSASVIRCAACGAETLFVTVAQAALVCSLTQRAIFRLAEAGRLHSEETPAGELLVCAESLRRHAHRPAREESG